MKKIYLSLLLGFIAVAAFAQTDTLIYEDFQEDPTAEFSLYPSGGDDTWVNFDEDAIATYDNDPNHNQWYHSEFFYNSTDTISGITNYVAAALSYLTGFAVGNRTWLVLPPLEIGNDSYTLSWKSAPFQLPRYMDGYKVLVSTGENFPDEFTDTLYVAAQMTATTGDGNIPTLDNFEFSEGYIHANSLMDENYWDYFEDSTLLHGILEPHSVSLADFSGETIYIAFLHDADDDYFLAVDDILVEGLGGVGTSHTIADDFRLLLYPNPVDHQLNIMYRLEQPSVVQLYISDEQGRKVKEIAGASQLSGEIQYQVLLAGLPAGTYQVVLRVDDQLAVRSFVKR